MKELILAHERDVVKDKTQNLQKKLCNERPTSDLIRTRVHCLIWVYILLQTAGKKIVKINLTQHERNKERVEIIHYISN